MITPRTFAGAKVPLGPELGRGGEGIVCEVLGSTDLVAKIYTDHRATDRQGKVQAMVGSELHRHSSHISFPVSVLFDDHRHFLGFTMKRVRGAYPIHQLWGGRDRQAKFPHATVAFMVRVAANVARAVAELHQAGCVIGDINESGFLVTDKATAVLIDSDSFQVNAGGQVFPCVVGTPQYLPPEHQGVNQRSLGTRAPNHDNFGLAILIFRLLMAGTHPFMGIWHGRGDPPALPNWIRDFRYAYGANSKQLNVSPQPSAPPISWLPYEIRKSFEEAFGKSSADKRPAAIQWVALLDAFEKRLIQCRSSFHHHHLPTTSGCPWCSLEKARAVELFGPARPSLQQRPLRPSSVALPPVSPVIPAQHSAAPYLPSLAAHPSKVQLPNATTYSAGSRVGGTIIAIGVVAIVLLFFDLPGKKNSVPAPVSVPRTEPNAQQLQQQRQTVLDQFDFKTWPIGKRTSFNSAPFRFVQNRPFHFSSALITLTAIEKISDTAIRLHFNADVAPKLPTYDGGVTNHATSHFLLFVYLDSYTTIGYGSVVVSTHLYGEALQLVDGRGKKYSALNGIEGVAVEEFNQDARKALFPFGKVTPFSITFAIPDWPTDSLRFVSPDLHGHQGEWWWTIYNLKQ